MTLKNSYQKLDSLIESDACFAIYRLPNESSPKFVMQNNGEIKHFYDIEELEENRGFVIAPYKIKKETPVLIIRPDCTNLNDAVIPDRQNPGVGSERFKLDNINRNDYNRLFDLFYMPLKDGTLKKVVLSRSKSFARNRNFSPGASFYKAMEKYKNSYVFLFHTPISGTWLGSTPEILLSGRGNSWHTVALAGTQYQVKEKISWDDKNLREQHLVTSYLLNQLSSFNIKPEINGPYTTKAANLAHLKTDLDFTLPENVGLGKLIKSLHPTPAVSGLPKEEAFGYIDMYEGYDRRYYTGFIGMMNKSSDTNLYVNLRCMEIGKSLLTLFAGSGLVTSSNSRDEWKETEQKLKTMASIC